MSDHAAPENATAASCLKHSIEDDFNLVSEQAVLALMNGDGSGRVQRRPRLRIRRGHHWQ